jgi:hypothetical protein
MGCTLLQAMHELERSTLPTFSHYSNGHNGDKIISLSLT